MTRRRVAAAGLVAVACLSSACATGPIRRVAAFVTGRAGMPSDYTEEDLRADLATYAQGFQAAVVVASDSITAGTKDPVERRRALLWKIRLTPLALDAAFLPDPEQAYVALLALAVSQDDYLERGEGARLFGAQQPIAVETAELLAQRILAIGERFLAPAQLERARKQVQALVAEHPIRGEFVPDAARRAIAATAAGGPFDWIVGLPLAPFRALEGVDTGAQAIRDFNQTAIGFTQILSSLPQVLRWNAELLVYEVETHRSVEQGLAAFEAAARGIEGVAAAAQTLPADLRQEAALLVQQLEASQGEIQQTLALAQSAMADADRAGQTFAPMVASLESTASQLQQAGVAWTQLVEAIRGPDEGPGGDDGRPFDILDYERTATEIRAAAVELRGLVDDAQRSGGEGLGAVVDRVAWRALQLLLAFFALLFVYRRIEARLARGRA